jgi:thiol-disulfide isomerase/thioredoxin
MNRRETTVGRARVSGGLGRYRCCMRRRNLLIGGLLGLAIGGTVFAAMAGDDTPTARLNPNTPATLTIPKATKVTGKRLPTAPFTDWSGAQQQFATLGKPAVVNVWSFSCDPCIDEMPEFEEVYQSVKDRITFVGINSSGDPMSKAREFATKTGVTYPLWRDNINSDDSYSAAFNVASLPHTVVADAGGVVLWQKQGRLSGTELAAKLEELFPK